jgi:DNA-3-methyladenine glycosylase
MAGRASMSDFTQDQRAPRAFFAADPVTVARRLLGQRLVRVLVDGTRLSGHIVEVEAYLGVHDRAAHSYGGRRTARNEAMYARPGTAYVYFTYGMHHCVNVVCGAEDEPVAVLLRAVEPSEGMDAMRRLRNGAPRRAPLRDREIASGPGRLCQAMGIDRCLNGIDLVEDNRLWIELVPGRLVSRADVVNCPRVGVDSAGEWAHRPLRWYVRGNPNVSVPARFDRPPPPRVKPGTLRARR